MALFAVVVLHGARRFLEGSWKMVGWMDADTTHHLHSYFSEIKKIRIRPSLADEPYHENP
jgi:hypothetical protein